MTSHSQMKKTQSHWPCHQVATYTEIKKKHNSKFEIELQSNLWIYFHICFTTWKSTQSLITICLINILSFKSRQKAGDQTALTHTKSDSSSLSKVYLFCKIS